MRSAHLHKTRGPFASAAAALLVTLTVAASRAADPPAAAPAVRILIAYYSRTGNTEQMAKAVAEGVGRVAGATAELKKATDVTREDLDRAQGIILGCPTWHAGIPGEMKMSIERWSWTMKADLTDKVGGAFATGSGHAGGKEQTIVSLLSFLISNRMVVAGPLYRNEKTGGQWAELGAAAVTGPADPGISEAELDGARRLGERVAQLTKRLAK